jgi:hypothetical protein
MKRLAIFGAAVVAVSTLGIAGTAYAASAPSSSHRSSGAVNKPDTKKPPVVTAGSTWTYYDQSIYPLANCEVLSFGTGGVFTGSEGDVGKWTATATTVSISFVNSAFYYPGSFKGTYGTARGNFTGILKQKMAPKYSFGPEQLAPGSDPLGTGDCG